MRLFEYEAKQLFKEFVIFNIINQLINLAWTKIVSCTEELTQ